MNDNSSNSLAVALFSEILTNDQLIRNRLSRVLPKGMEISHFSVLNHLARAGDERSPAQLAKSFHVTARCDDQHPEQTGIGRDMCIFAPIGMMPAAR